MYPPLSMLRLHLDRFENAMHRSGTESLFPEVGGPSFSEVLSMYLINFFKGVHLWTGTPQGICEQVLRFFVCLFHGNLGGTPQCHPPPMVNNPLIRPYFLGGGIGGAPLGSHVCFQWTVLLESNRLSVFFQPTFPNRCVCEVWNEWLETKGRFPSCQVDYLRGEDHQHAEVVISLVVQMPTEKAFKGSKYTNIRIPFNPQI